MFYDHCTKKGEKMSHYIPSRTSTDINRRMLDEADLRKLIFRGRLL